MPSLKAVEKISAIRQLRQQITRPVGLVPTMGHLHEGHLALVRRAKAECQTVIVSIFINPTQFSPQEDFERYPRDIRRDLSFLEKEGVNIVFIPAITEMYPERFNCWVDVSQITEFLEGFSRPSHFRGVATIVAKLFNIIQPDKAYFGQKDAQQVMVIKKMVADLNMNLEVITVPTVREPDGLAMSSRNSYLNPREHQAATVLYQSLILAQKLWAQGEKNAGQIREQMKALITEQPLANIDYVSIANTETLEELNIVNTPALVSIAVKIGKTRLIDNVVLE